VAVTAPPLLVAYRALGLGDLLTAVPALRALARMFPDHRRVLAAPAALEPLALLSGAVDVVADTGEGKDGPPPLPAELRGADLVVNLHGRGPQSHARVAESAPRGVIGFDGGSWRADEHEVHRWCRLLSEHEIPADPAELDLAEPPWSAPPEAEEAVLIHPGAASAARRWPVDRWRAVAAALEDPVVVTGSAAERELAAGVGGTNLAGRTDLRGLAAAVAAARLVICGDTGVAHLATAFGTPSVVLFGPTDPAHWGPPPRRGRHEVIWHGRTGDPHAARPDEALLDIGVEDVLAGVSAVASRRAHPCHVH
jgi:ADP-heptose:LPS heptosyltransferase